MSGDAPRTVLWWGRFDPEYSRNRILRQAFVKLEWQIKDFFPRISRFADLQANFAKIETPDAIWVPAFRQRDCIAAARWANSRNVPLIFDPLISAYDKQFFEREKFAKDSRPAQKLLAWEKRIFAAADTVIADTQGHADFFTSTLGVAKDKINVIAVGAEENIFKPFPTGEKSRNDRFEVLFYGSFISLQAPHIIVEAAKRCPTSILWTLIGDGPERARCQRLAAGQDNIVFEPPLPYKDLPARIHKADILLGIFGESDKAARVIPNKVYQSLACGKPVVTRQSKAYPLQDSDGLVQIMPGDPAALAATINQLFENKNQLQKRGAAAYKYYETNFNQLTIEKQLAIIFDNRLKSE